MISAVRSGSVTDAAMGLECISTSTMDAAVNAEWRYQMLMVGLIKSERGVFRLTNDG